jgi:membrane protease YdiL (CAAX protease family)
MAPELKSLIPKVECSRQPSSVQGQQPGPSLPLNLAELQQVAVVFALIMIAVWTPQGRINTVGSLLAAFCILWFTVRSHYPVRELGLASPRSGVGAILAVGALMVAAIVVAGWLMHNLGHPQPVPWKRAWQYAIWSLQQEFILQSFFFVRLESVLGGRRAAVPAALLFCIAHIPNPALTVLSFIGGLVFCELFRRYRNLFPLGVVHAALGLTIAASLPDSLLHHMRVGLGYLLYRP